MLTGKFKLISIICLMLLMPRCAFAQELQCEVTTDLVRIPSEARIRLANFSRVVESYMNSYRWTDEDFQNEDRISCRMEFVFTAADISTSPPRYSAQVFVGSSRPVYNSLQKTSMLRILDANLEFVFDERQGVLQHNDLTFESLSSFLSFYALVILGYDVDTFTKLGGNQYFNRAQQLSQLARSQGGLIKGWDYSDGGGNNRTVLINEMVDPKFQPLREEIFNYHYNGLDEIYRGPSDALEAIIKAVEKFTEIDARYNRSLIVRRFFDAKYIEIAQLFKTATPEQKDLIYKSLIQVDPTHKQTYDQIFSSQPLNQGN
ncbi:MAG: DUF4835 family protein [Chlorobiales bacterium]|nr:DUF4835 family protein [Chlorobiales bacterium]